MYLSSRQNSGKPCNTKVLSGAEVLLNQYWLGRILARSYLFVDHIGQINEHEQVEQSQHNLKHGDMANDFVQLPGQKGAGQNQGEIFCPDLFEHQAGAFDNIQRGIEKNSEANLFEP